MTITGLLIYEAANRVTTADNSEHPKLFFAISHELFRDSCPRPANFPEVHAPSQSLKASLIADISTFE